MILCTGTVCGPEYEQEPALLRYLPNNQLPASKPVSLQLSALACHLHTCVWWFLLPSIVIEHTACSRQLVVVQNEEQLLSNMPLVHHIMSILMYPNRW